MFNKQYVIVAILTAGLLMFGSQAAAVNIAGEQCEYELTASAGGSRAKVKIFGHFLEVRITGAHADTLYTVWVDFRKRAPLALADDYQRLIEEGKNPLPRGVAPAFATTSGVTAGMGVDPNGMITDDRGEARLRAILDYDLLKPGESPVVGAELAMQGLNRVGGLQVYR